jgi:prenyltransferase beta subunit
MTKKLAFSGTLTLLLLLALTFPTMADGPSAVAWLKSQQNPDGGFGTPESGVGVTADAIVAVAATGENALSWATEQSALAYLEENAASPAKAGDMAKVILALTSSGQNPRDLAGVDLIAQLDDMVGDDGKIGGDADFVNEHSYAMIALASAERQVSQIAIDYLLNIQIEDGTWSWNGDTTLGNGDNNTAAIAVTALIAAGVPASNPQIQKTIAHLAEQQNADGGFPYIKPSPYGTDSDANSTAVVIWALIAAGEDPAGNKWKYQGQDGHSAYDRLQAFQNESGAFRWQEGVPDDNLAATVQALVALEFETLPFTTMAVGEAVGGISEEPTTPELLPETGADLWLGAWILLGSGVTLIGAGLALRRR